MTIKTGGFTQTTIVGGAVAVASGVQGQLISSGASSVDRFLEKIDTSRNS